MPELTKEEREWLRRLDKVATPAPWVLGEGGIVHTPADGDKHDEDRGKVEKIARRRLICAMRNALPALLDAADERDGYKTALEGITAMHATTSEVWRDGAEYDKGFVDGLLHAVSTLKATP